MKEPKTAEEAIQIMKDQSPRKERARRVRIALGQVRRNKRRQAKKAAAKA